MHILGYSPPENMSYTKENGNDYFNLSMPGTGRYDSDGKFIPQPTHKGQLHIYRGLVSHITGCFREYLSPYSWEPVYINEDFKVLRKTLFHYPRGQPNTVIMDGKLLGLAGESPYWAKHFGQGNLRKSNSFHSQEYIVSKNHYWTRQAIGIRGSCSESIEYTRDAFIPVYRSNSLFDKIKLIFLRLFNPTLIEVQSPSSGDKFCIHAMDYKLVCKVLGENLVLDQSYDDKFGFGIDSTQVNWLQTL